MIDTISFRFANAGLYITFNIHIHINDLKQLGGQVCIKERR